MLLSVLLAIFLILGNVGTAYGVEGTPENDVVASEDKEESVIYEVHDQKSEDGASSLRLLLETEHTEIHSDLQEIYKKISEPKESDDDETQKEMLVTLEDISGKLDMVLLEESEPDPKPVKAVRANGAEFTAYANASPTSQYATYAAHLVPKVAWNHDYVFLQDTNSSYVFVSGDCDFRQSGEFTFTNADYTRWYYGGTGTGYLVQSGHGDVVVHAGNYVVLSSLGSYPLLDDGITLLRNEVSFYAICAVVLYVLGNIRSFLLRSA